MANIKKIDQKYNNGGRGCGLMVPEFGGDVEQPERAHMSSMWSTEWYQTLWKAV